MTTLLMAMVMAAIPTFAFAAPADADPNPVIVAIIDTGADTQHPDIKNNLWNNPGESGRDEKGRSKATNGIDDDKNGFIDDVHGWNFIKNSADVSDKNGHGSHIAGIITQKTAGETPLKNFKNVRLMVLKYYDDAASAQNALANTIKAIRYANQMNADIINYSGGGTQASLLEKQAIQESLRKNILFIAAAGNEKADSDVNPYYPADYDLSNVLSVTAHDSKNKILDSSNYGKKSVDIAALGKDVLSAVPGGRKETMTGTSQATAQATQAAAVLMSEQPAYRKNPLAAIKQLLATGVVESDFQNKVRSQARLDIQKSLKVRRADISSWGTTIQNFDNIEKNKIWDANMLGQIQLNN